MPPSTADSEPTALHLGGDLRLTRQRREVYDVLMEQRDHPTATELFIRVKDRVPTISLATVYNCLETLAGVGLVKQVNLDRAPSRYCPNLQDHGHFHCTRCGAITDIEFKEGAPHNHLRLPRGAIANHIDVAIKGLCPDCAAQSRKKKSPDRKAKPELN
ncbi:MAG: Fur family transcriptional regulator [Verrucomicrobiales bacterium]